MMFENIKKDIKRYNCSTRKNLIRTILLTKGVHSTIIYRFGQFARRQILPLSLPLIFLHFILEKLVTILYGIHISIKAEIGPGLYIGHFGGIYIGECKMGKNCSINQRTVIKLNNDGKPIIGNNVWIGGQAHVVGPIKVGDRVTISAGSIVTDDLRPYCLVAGNPARIIKLNFDNSVIL